ncbi:hypothetical protein KHM83_13390 [Fusibacter paucivorans]|uniref:Uncharacterized protein n=1 Tax=Fusibacter paucivorans TaxID=76009 RepID=A0ABS5PTG3_9FIRM|nr:hypothetical protein [Fusibacter paucivorans]MBS7527674.1 hypothetical protein [Fusibacter paucivorans]
MAKFKSQHHNNLFIGDRSKLVTKEIAPVKALANDTTDINVRLYVAQYNFIDTHLSGKSILLGQAMDLPTGDNYVDLTVAAGSTFEDVLVAAHTAGFLDNISITSYGSIDFLNNFEYKNTTYDAINSSQYTMTPVTGTTPETVISGYWDGWSPTYFDGTDRPQSILAYPELAINQYPIQPKSDGSKLYFVLDYTKSEATY